MPAFIKFSTLAKGIVRVSLVIDSNSFISGEMLVVYICIVFVFGPTESV